jgi:hypothetical protein
VNTACGPPGLQAGSGWAPGLAGSCFRSCSGGCHRWWVKGWVICRSNRIALRAATRMDTDPSHTARIGAPDPGRPLWCPFFHRQMRRRAAASIGDCCLHESTPPQQVWHAGPFPAGGVQAAARHNREMLPKRAPRTGGFPAAIEAAAALWRTAPVARVWHPPDCLPGICQCHATAPASPGRARRRGKPSTRKLWQLLGGSVHLQDAWPRARVVLHGPGLRWRAQPLPAAPWLPAGPPGSSPPVAGWAGSS